MNSFANDIAYVVLIGIGATAVMDAWVLVLKRLNVPTLDFALIGRWAGHWPRGILVHESIAKASPVKRELALGWLVHYLVGIGFAGLAVTVLGMQWARDPRVLPALGIGMVTVAAPWLVMQPAMGSGIASSRTRTPHRNRLRSLVNHTVFGFGLYLAATLITTLITVFTPTPQ